jgi:hypothetical protein
LTSHDDFVFGLRANKALFDGLQQRFDAKLARLQGEYDERVKMLYIIAEKQGVSLSLPKEALLLNGAKEEGEI